MEAWLPVAALAALVLAAGVPAAAAADLPEVSAPAASAPATLYLHLLNIQDFPINTQVPDPGFTDQAGYGVASETLTCIPNPPAGGSPFQGYHTWRGYSSPAYVEYGSTQGGMPRVWPERQMGYNGSLAGAAPVLHWFLATQAAPGPGGDAPVVVPNVVVEATARGSDDAASPMDVAIDADTGPVLFQGQSTPALLAMDASQGVTHSEVRGRHVYEFTVPMPVQRAALGGKGFTLRIDARMDAPGCADGDHAAMPNAVVPYSDPEHRPRIELTAADPLRVVRLSPRFANGTVQVTGLATALWGNYDVDESNLTLAVGGPDGKHYLDPDNVTLLSHAHGHHADPLNATWTLPARGLAGGVYWLDWTVSNDQHTANATAHAAFRIGPERAYDAPDGGGLPDVSMPGQAAPAGPLVPLALALAAGLASARRGRGGDGCRDNKA